MFCDFKLIAKSANTATKVLVKVKKTELRVNAQDCLFNKAVGSNKVIFKNRKYIKVPIKIAAIINNKMTKKFCCTKTLKIKNLAKKPAKGGIPAKENKQVTKEKNKKKDV